MKIIQCAAVREVKRRWLLHWSGLQTVQLPCVICFISILSVSTQYPSNIEQFHANLYHVGVLHLRHKLVLNQPCQLMFSSEKSFSARRGGMSFSQDVYWQH